MESNINLPPEQQAIRGKCFHSSGAFVEFPMEDVETSIPARFEKIVGLHADRIAVKTETRVATYSQLNEMANRLAHALFQRQGRRAQLVALLLEKDVAQVAAMLGAMKAGKFFLILDPAFPKYRLAAMLKGSRAKLVVTNRRNASLADEIATPDCELIQWEGIDDSFSRDNPEISIAPKALAFINYTSGSTGEPKALLRSHRMILHNIMLRTNLIHVCELDRISLLSSGTSNAITNSLLALLNGAGLYSLDVKKQGVVRPARWLAEGKITITPMSSPLFRALCETLKGKNNFPDLRVVRLRSEAVYKSDTDLYRQYFSPDCIFVTGLSSNETGPLADYFIDHDTVVTDSAVPVGYAAPGKEVVLLNQDGERIGFDEIGEIAVRSRYLSPGYLRDSRLAKTKFKCDPTESGSRIYLTGDMGLMLPNGCLIYKGRKDFRVKIRGFPVDIKEVETALRAHPSLRDAVVIARSSRSGETVLVAYFVTAARQVPTVSELMRFLARMLPDYMIPVAFVRLDSMPLNPQNKVDRAALPSPAETRPDLDTPFMAPRGDEEREVADIWAEVLGIDRVGIQDNFLELGGHSLAAARIVTRVTEKFHLELPLQVLFDSPTVEKMALVITENQSTGHKSGEHGSKPSNDAMPARSVETAIGFTPFPKEDLERSIPEQSQEGFLPLSYSQQRLWFLDQLDPGSFTYNLFFACRLKGDLNVDALEQSFNEIIRRHEILRTVFKNTGGEPYQIVVPSLAIKIALVDLRRTFLKEDRWTEVRRQFTEEAQRPFDLAIGPLLRIKLLQLTDDEYVLLRTMHHIVSDGWSGGVLSHELSEIYAAFLNGEPSPLAGLTRQYLDYVAWQRQWFQGERLESQLSFWKKQLNNITTLNLPTDRPRQALQARRGARRYFAFSDEISSELKKLGRQHGATLFMTLLAAFQTLLHRYSGQTDIVVGSPVAGRNHQEFEQLIGFFVNTLVLRLDLSSNPTFIETLRRAREVCLQALSHQDLPFEKLVEKLDPDRKLTHNPLFQVTFVFQNTPRVSPKLSDIVVEELEVDTGIARFDLHLFMEEIDSQLKGYCDFDTNLFSAATIERMLGHFKVLLEGIVADPDQRIGQLPLLTEAEKQQLLVQWNDTKIDYPREKCIHQLFEEQVEKTPDAIALVLEDQQLTYRELNKRANQLAHYLRKRNVGPEVLVGIWIDRSTEMIVAILGVLKAGGAYVPLDPSYPAERLEFTLAPAALLLTQGESFEDREVNLDDTARRSILDPHMPQVCLDTAWQLIAKESDANPESSVTVDNLAYVIYTSGSTGQPKGVAIEHRNTVAFLSWVHSAFTQEELSGVLASTSICFDLSVFEIFAPLSCGGTIIMAENALALTTIPTKSKVSLLNTVPSAINELLRLEAIPSTVRVINLAGELLRPELMRRIYESTSVRKVHDLYGPSECTTYSTWTCRTVDGPQTIGRPIANTQIYISDAHRNPVPIGVVGELYVGGDGVARGYLKQPELTAEKFIPHPFSDQPGTRLYKTGDLARYLPDGNIEFLGRIDNQVKLRGYRIELGEVETVLGQHPMVQSSVVVVREDVAGNKRLVGLCGSAAEEIVRGCGDKELSQTEAARIHDSFSFRAVG